MRRCPNILLYQKKEDAIPSPSPRSKTYATLTETPYCYSRSAPGPTRPSRSRSHCPPRPHSPLRARLTRRPSGRPHYPARPARPSSPSTPPAPVRAGVPSPAPRGDRAPPSGPRAGSSSRRTGVRRSWRAAAGPCRARTRCPCRGARWLCRGGRSAPGGRGPCGRCCGRSAP